MTQPIAPAGMDREKIARAIGEADAAFGYRLTLTRLVDGVSTYTLVMPGYACEFEDQDEAYAVIAEARNKSRADAILALATPTTGSPAAGEVERLLSEALAYLDRYNLMPKAKRDEMRRVLSAAPVPATDEGEGPRG